MSSTTDTAATPMQQTIIAAATGAADALSQLRGTVEGMSRWLDEMSAYLPAATVEAFQSVRGSFDERVRQAQESEQGLANIISAVADADPAMFNTTAPKNGGHAAALLEAVKTFLESVEGETEAQQEDDD